MIDPNPYQSPRESGEVRSVPWWRFVNGISFAVNVTTLLVSFGFAFKATEMLNASQPFFAIIYFGLWIVTAALAWISLVLNCGPG